MGAEKQAEAFIQQHQTKRHAHRVQGGQDREKLLTSGEADDPDVQELLVRQALLELLPPVVCTARAAPVVHLLLLRQQWRRDAALHWPPAALHRQKTREEEEEQSRQCKSTHATTYSLARSKRRLVGLPKRFRHGFTTSASGMEQTAEEF